MLRFLIGLLVGLYGVPGASADDKWVVQKEYEAFSLLSEYEVDSAEIDTQVKLLCRELQDLLKVGLAGEPIQIILFESRASYLDYLGETVPASRIRRAVFFRRGSLTSIYCYRSDTTITDLRHEMTHAILHQHLQFLPLWLDEGLAEYFEERFAERNVSSRIRSVRWKAAIGWVPDLDRLESKTGSESLDLADYRDSWAMCCFLLNNSDDSQQLLYGYLEQIHVGNAPLKFSEYLSSKMPDWKTQSKAFFRRPVFRQAARPGE